MSWVWITSERGLGVGTSESTLVGMGPIDWGLGAMERAWFPILNDQVDCSIRTFKQLTSLMFKLDAIEYAFDLTLVQCDWAYWLVPTTGHAVLSDSWRVPLELEYSWPNYRSVSRMRFKYFWLDYVVQYDCTDMQIQSEKCQEKVPFRFMPCSRHFRSRQYWQRLRCFRLIIHCLSRLQRYTRRLQIDRLKNPLQPEAIWLLCGKLPILY